MKLHPLLIGAMGVALLALSVLKVSIHYLLLALPIAVIIGVVSKIGSRHIVKTINNFLIRFNRFTLIDQGKYISGVIFKLERREGERDETLYQKELDHLLALLSKRTSTCQYYVVTTLKRRPGSAVVIYCNANTKERSEELAEEESKFLLSLAGSLCPHLNLSPVGFRSSLLPVPAETGSLSYARVFDVIPGLPMVSPLSSSYDVMLGRVNDSFGSEVGLEIKDITRHIAIFGTTGSGKSTTASIIANRLAEKGVKVVILDWHGEYRNLVPAKVIYDSGNRLVIDPLKMIENDVDEVVEILGDVLQLTEPQRYLLFSILTYLKRKSNFSMESMKEALDEIDDSSYWMREVKYALARKLYVFFTKGGKMLFSKSENTEGLLTSLMEKGGSAIVMDLSFIRNLRLRRLYGTFVIKLVVDFAMINKLENPVLVMIEEAQNYFSMNNEFLDKMLSEIRKYNVGLCVITQSPSSVSAAVMKNTNIKIIHTIKSDIDKRVVRDSMSLDQSIIAALDKLDQGFCLFQAPSLVKPVILKVS